MNHFPNPSLDRRSLLRNGGLVLSLGAMRSSRTRVAGVACPPVEPEAMDPLPVGDGNTTGAHASSAAIISCAVSQAARQSLPMHPRQPRFLTVGCSTYRRVCLRAQRHRP